MKEGRNCCNAKGLSDRARGVTEYTPEITAEHREKKAGKVWGLGDIRLYECPLTYITPETWEIVRLAYMVENGGHLLHPGGWGAQPAWLVEAMQIYAAETARQIAKTRRAHDERKKN